MLKNKLHVIFGASGNIGSLVTKKLVEKGKKVRVITSSSKSNFPEEVEIVQADALDLEETKRAAEGASVIYHCIGASYPEWTIKLPVFMHNIIEAAAAQGNDTKVVYADNLYMYGKESAMKGPLTEITPQLASGKKGQIRKKVAENLMDAHVQGKLKATIGRGSDFFGPNGTNSTLEYFVIKNALAGKGAKMFGDIDKLHSYIYLEDFTKGLITLAENDNAFGEVWHLPHAKAITNREMMERIYKEFGYEANGKFGSNPTFLITIGGLFNKVIREIKEVIYQQQINWVVDDNKFTTTFRMSATPLEESIQQTVNWYKSH